MIFAIQLKKYIANARIYHIAICKLDYWQKPSPVILFKIDKSLEINLYYTILVFCLFVSLRIIYNKKPLFDAKEITI